MDIIEMAAGKIEGHVYFKDEPFEIRSVWECACSGDGHPIGEPNAKCFRKGGEWRKGIFHAVTGIWAGGELPGDLQTEFVNDHGWQRIPGNDVFTQGNGFFVRPSFWSVLNGEAT